MMRRRVGALGLACHRWAVAVAGFGQKLKRDPRVSDAFGWSDILSLAQAGRGPIPSVSAPSSSIWCAPPTRRNPSPTAVSRLR